MTLILAAGTSSRLRPLTTDIPKSLLSVGAESLLSRLLRQFNLTGNKDIVVITGYLNQKIDENTPNDVKKIYYENYSSTNNFHTLNDVREKIKGPILILFADIYLSNEAAEKIKDQVEKMASFLVVDTGRVLKTTMGVVVEDGLISEILEGTRKEIANGNFVGIAFFTKEDFEKLSSTLKKYENCPRDKYYTYAIQMMIEAGHRINALNIGGQYWCEIDTEEEYETLKKEIAQ